MSLFLLGIIVFLIGGYFFRARESEKLVKDLIEAVDEKRRFLLKESSAKMQTKNASATLTGPSLRPGHLTQRQRVQCLTYCTCSRNSLRKTLYRGEMQVG